MKQHTIHPMDEVRVIRAGGAPLLFSYEQLVRALAVCQAYDTNLRAQVAAAEAQELAAAEAGDPQTPEGGDQDAENPEQGPDGEGESGAGQSEFDRIEPDQEAHPDQGI